MAVKARLEYGNQLRLRRAGVASTLNPNASLNEAKPHFYADAQVLISRVREVYAGYKDSSPPYGLKDRAGSFIGSSELRSPWAQLEGLMSLTARRAFEEVIPPDTGCPYHPALQNLGKLTLRPKAPQSRDKERLREIVVPGAQFAPTTIVNILSRMPAIASVNQSTTPVEQLARNSSRSLLREPLYHPQQYAKAFVFCLGDGIFGEDMGLDRSNFMPNEVIADYTQVGHNQFGHEMVEWSKPTTDFVLRATVHVANRLEGTEADTQGDHITTYLPGTRLGDIHVDEPTIGCPGVQLAYDMWDQAIDVAVGEGLWDRPT